MTIRSGARGIDSARQLIPPTIDALIADNNEFVIRYLSRAAFTNPADIRGIEADTIRARGLALGFVQHCPPKLWTPNLLTARADATTAVRQLHNIGAAYGTTIWFDLESVEPSSDATMLEHHVNLWSDVIEANGFESGAYVGSGCLLGPAALFHNLKVTRYWSSYNLDLDRYPAVRGVCMHQHPARADKQWADIDVVSLDSLGGIPTFWEPGT